MTGKEAVTLPTDSVLTTLGAYQYLFLDDRLMPVRAKLQACNLNDFISPNLRYDRSRSEMELNDNLSLITQASGMVLKGQRIICILWLALFIQHFKHALRAGNGGLEAVIYVCNLHKRARKLAHIQKKACYHAYIRYAAAKVHERAENGNGKIAKVVYNVCNGHKAAGIRQRLYGYGAEFFVLPVKIGLRLFLAAECLNNAQAGYAFFYLPVKYAKIALSFLKKLFCALGYHLCKQRYQPNARKGDKRKQRACEHHHYKNAYHREAMHKQLRK